MTAALIWIGVLAANTAAATTPPQRDQPLAEDLERTRDLPAQAREGNAFGVDAGPLAMIPPMVGFRFGGETSRFTFALPWSVQFGPLLRGETGDGLRPFRAVFEPGLALPYSGGSTSYFLRLGLRYVANAAGILGIGLGWGYTQSLSIKPSSSLSQEILLTLGRCCSPGSVILSVRYEYSFSAQGELWTSLGYALW
jgi:hypothetical protein